tara:strand:- start:1100 stop:2251 length:1152 start_codon:yes stop_codon:yes gene_type:complete
MRKIFFISILFSSVTLSQTLIPKLPQITASSFLLIDAETNKIIAQQNPEASTGLASITKIMTSYIVADYLKKGFLKIKDSTTVSEKCWRMEGSRMFIQEGKKVSIEDLMRGMIVQSGNDAACALAEHIAGTQEDFAILMNDYAKKMELKNTNFTNPTGLPNINHYSTAEDIAKLSIFLINDFPDEYSIFSEKEFTYNDIRQFNRNSLLFQDDSIDGIKTGHTQASGYCLVASSKRGDMRLISIVLNSVSEKSRRRDTRRLLDYGFKYYQTKKIVSKYEPISIVDVWGGTEDQLELGPDKDIFITLTKPSFERLSFEASKNLGVKAPISKDSVIDRLDIIVDGEIIQSVDLVAVNNVQSKGIILSTLESLMFYIYSFFMQDEIN